MSRRSVSRAFGDFVSYADYLAIELGIHQTRRCFHRLIRLKNESPFWPPWLLAAIVVRVSPIHSSGTEIDPTDASFIARMDNAS